MARRNRSKDSIEYRGTGLYLSLAVVLVLIAALLVLAVQNTESVNFEFLWWETDFPLFGLILGGGLLAVLLDETIGLVWRWGRRRRLTERQELRRLRGQERERREPQPEADADAEAGTTSETEAENESPATS